MTFLLSEELMAECLGDAVRQKHQWAYSACEAFESAFEMPLNLAPSTAGWVRAWQSVHTLGLRQPESTREQPCSSASPSLAG
jgi:hypothetical protein